MKKAVFIALLIFCLSPWGSPPVALALGLVIAFTFGNPFPQLEGKFTKYLLQASVVLLGFGMDLGSVYRAGKQGILFTIATIFGTLILGFFVGKLLGVANRTSTLISSGTAICGGSAIGAVGPAINAEADEMSVSLGTVFVLNSVALFLFPVIGHALNLSQNQFGVWAAIAIHDTSSVVGAAGTYGAEALAIATTVKLARALWIAPVALLFAYLYRPRLQVPSSEFRVEETDFEVQNAETKNSELETRNAKRSGVIPWFIFLFLGATALRTYLPVWIQPSIYDSLVNLAKAGMTVTLFLIGASLTRQTLQKFGYWALLEGVILWIVISIVGLVAVWNLL